MAYGIKYILDKGQPRREEKFEYFDTWQERDKRKEELKNEADEAFGWLEVIEEFQI